ncbi:SprB repeat-containing protein [Carboxylicivirga sp. N1Y90]|uniref:SprB repeat-containing protein n=1 Tax=Carboxylicivirga fragile TaxID=3417571 RepID=UPI003D33EDCC|nr:SprB repeat-containing protein [Marinilabiliaceae bacterium N1Y90]
MNFTQQNSNWINCSKYNLLLLIVVFNCFLPSFAEETGGDCINCFTTELISMEQVDECITIELEVNASNCNYALSHFTAEIPCGTVSEASNSGNWLMELNSTDPTTGIQGIKVDDIANFGENGATGSFRLTYTICSDNADCIRLIKNEDFRVAYKAATCVFIDTIEIDNSNLEAQIESFNPTCYGSNDGHINVTITEGTPPYNFLWNTGDTTEDLDKLNAGSYEVTINDAAGKSINLSSELIQAPEIITNSTITHTNCNANDGAIQTITEGGTPPYSYEWNNGATTKDIDQLGSGTYSLIVTDSKDCSKTYNYSLKKLTSLRATVSTDVLKCYENGFGELTVNATGGTEPYTYLWANGDTSNTSKNLDSGSHKVLIRDAMGCEIEKYGYVILERLSVTTSTIQPVCNGESTGSSTLSISEGTEPYEVKWSTGDTTLTIENLNAGWYYAEVRDSMGCSFRKYVQIKEPNEIKLQAIFNRSSCNEADSIIKINLSASGGTSPYTYYYNQIETENNLQVDKEGYYTFSVVDINGCEKTDSILVTRNKAELESNITVTQPSCQQSEFGTVYVTISSGTAPYIYYWSDGVTSANRTDLTPGTYTLEITDSKNCSATHEVNINEILLPSLKLTMQDATILCSSFNNILNAETINVVNTEWLVESTNNDWAFEETNIDYALFSSGSNQATFIAKGISSDGCTVIDTLTTACSEDDIKEPIDPDDPKDDCEICYTWENLYISSLDNECFKYEAVIKTDGSCRYDLSHLTVQIEEGNMSDIYNSKGWKTEQNSKDPTTGIYGFKLDDIANFGKKDKNQFELSFTICNSNEAQTSFVVAYKAAQCVSYDTIYFDANIAELPEINSFPNPFTDMAQIEFTPTDNEHVELNIYDIQGNLMEQLFKGEVQKDVKYQFNFKPDNSSSNIFFYHLIYSDEIKQGKLLQIR